MDSSDVVRVAGFDWTVDSSDVARGTGFDWTLDSSCVITGFDWTVDEFEYEKQRHLSLYFRF